MVGDDVHIDFHSAPVRCINESLELCIRPEMWVDAGEVSHPIAVIARAFLTRPALHGLVLETPAQTRSR